MGLVRRILLLAAVSLAGLALLAPLAARSAVPAPAVDLDDHLLPAGPAPLTTLDRGAFSARVSTPSLPGTGAAESLDADAPPTPGVVDNEATIVTVVAPPSPPPAAPASPPRTYRGTSVWDDLARCESGGNWSINTGNGYYGGLQFSYSTWHAYGGGEFAEYPHQATRAEQIAVAERLRAARGYAPWPSCRAKLGLP